jgi:hypothetical protein
MVQRLSDRADLGTEHLSMPIFGAAIDGSWKRLELPDVVGWRYVNVHVSRVSFAKA